MGFDSGHYVPILKSKRGEKTALAMLSPAVQRRITPLIEIVERKPEKPLAVHLSTTLKGMAAAVRPYSRCLLDVRELAPDGPSAAIEVFRRAREDGIAFIPVTGVTRTVDVDAAIDNSDRGLGLRLTRVEFESGGLPRQIERFLSKHDLDHESIDLIVDLGPVSELIREGVSAMSEQFLADVPDHRLWRTFTITASAFPRSMATVERHSFGFSDRSEWLAWCALYARRTLIERMPTFSDTAVQHPSGVEGFDPRTMQSSASIRYTLSEQWLRIKGQGTRKKPPSEQFPILAAKLTSGELQPHFYGADHCAGCAGIQASADHEPRLGSPEVWRRLGTIHHLTTVTEQLSSMP